MKSMIKVHIANIIFFVKTNFVVIIDYKSTNSQRFLNLVKSTLDSYFPNYLHVYAPYMRLE